VHDRVIPAAPVAAAAVSGTAAASLVTVWYWALFFATSVYGHVALKLAVDRSRSGAAGAVLATSFSWWGVSAYASWALSAALWMLVVARHDLFQASSISSARYVLICASGVVLLGDAVTWQRAAGAALITAGILLVK
jgi:hypothetical protein